MGEGKEWAKAIGNFIKSGGTRTEPSHDEKEREREREEARKERQREQDENDD